MMCFMVLQFDRFEVKWTKAEEPSSAAEDKFGRRKCSMFGFRSSDSAPECCMVSHAIGQPKLSWLVSWVMFFWQVLASDSCYGMTTSLMTHLYMFLVGLTAVWGACKGVESWEKQKLRFWDFESLKRGWSVFPLFSVCIFLFPKVRAV